MACSKLFKILKKNLVNFFSFYKLTTRKIFNWEEIFYLFYVAKSIGVEVISILKICTFAAKMIILRTLLQFSTWTLEIAKLNRNDYYLATEIEKEQKKYVSFLIVWLFWNKPFSGFLEPYNFFSTKLRKLLLLEKMWIYREKDSIKKYFRISPTLFL